MSRARAVVLALLSAGLLASCGAPSQPRLAVELSATPVAAPFLVHGNCFAGWFLSLPLRIRGENAGLVSMESLDVRVEDALTRQLLGQDHILLGVRLLDERGSGLSLDVPVSLRIADEAGPPWAAIVVSGEALGRGPDGGLRAPFRLEAVPAIVWPSPGGGACSALP